MRGSFELIGDTAIKLYFNCDLEYEAAFDYAKQLINDKRELLPDAVGACGETVFTEVIEEEFHLVLDDGNVIVRNTLYDMRDYIEMMEYDAD